MMSKPYTPPYIVTPNMVRLVEIIGESIGRISMAPNISIKPHLRRNNQIKTIQASLNIEGNTLNLEQVTAVLEGKRILGSAREIQEVYNAFTAYDRIEDWNPCHVSHLCEAHGKMMKGLEENCGKFRSTGVGIHRKSEIVHIAPPAKKVPDLINDLFGWLKNSPDHPLIKGAVMHYELEFIHPFMDGNGRIGRLWNTLILGKWKPLFYLLPVESVIRDRQKKYYEALKNSDAKGESTPLVEFLLEAIHFALKELTPQVTPQATPQVEKLVKAITQEMNRVQLMEALSLKDRKYFSTAYLQPALKAGLVEMTIPKKPRSSNQKYRLTNKGSLLR
ncbi:Fic family protein [Desulfobacula sp.]|uniref:Fic family protein n=1 Tax=Desulfobacula sp. TaxID=2593537 RepID=UPI0025C41EB0|nr:Fic family protein [Desulfobacula sp.]